MKKILFSIFFSIGLVAQESYIDYISPYHPTAVTSEQGMVVSQNYLSSDIGIEILDKGGNAIDAAVAVGFLWRLPVSYTHLTLPTT